MADNSDDFERVHTSWFVAALAAKPPLVVLVTFAIGAVATVILMVAFPSMDAVAIVSTLATLWGLDLALVIYLLTARDTDKLLSHIDALQGQLSAALDAPGPDAVVVSQEPQQAAQESQQPPAWEPPLTSQEPQQAVAPEAPLTRPAKPATPAVQPAEAPRRPAPALSPQLWASSLTERMPADYLETLRRQAGVEPADIRRAWTPSPSGNGPWVVEEANGNRWSVFPARGGKPMAIPLGSRASVRQRREDRVAEIARSRVRQAEDRAMRAEKRTEKEIAHRANPHRPDDR